jgi:hypothetical protein
MPWAAWFAWSKGNAAQVEEMSAKAMKGRKKTLS